MTMYYVNEAAFELPWDELEDRSVNVFEKKLEGGEHLSLAVQRGRYAEGDSYESVLARQVEKASRSLRGYHLTSRRDVEVAGRRAVDIATRWRSDRSVVATRQVMIDLGPGWMIFSVNAPVSDVETADACMDHVIGTLRLRED
jgi:hypothetical protein